MNLINRLKEPSTYAALAAALAALGMNIDDSIIQGVTQAGMGISALVAIFLKETGSDA